MKEVLMVIVMWLPAGNHLKEAWRIEKHVSLEHCLQMSDIFNRGGRAAVSTVRCEKM